jgi:hypothetical protein
MGLTAHILFDTMIDRQVLADRAVSSDLVQRISADRRRRKGGEETLGRPCRMYDGRLVGRAVLALVSSAMMPLGRGREWFPPLSEPLSFAEHCNVLQAGNVTANRPVETGG